MKLSQIFRWKSKPETESIEVPAKDVQLIIDGFAVRFQTAFGEAMYTEIEGVGKKMLLSDMRIAINIFLDNAVRLLPEPICRIRMKVVEHMCYGFGAGICGYIDNTAFGEYDWTQYDAIELLCRMAAFAGLRKDWTISRIKVNIKEFRYETIISTLASLRYFKDDNEVSEIYEWFLQEYNDSYNDAINILAYYQEQNPANISKHLPFLKNIVLNTGENDFSIGEMAYVFRNDNEGLLTAYNKDGTEFSMNEGIETNKVIAAVIYYLTDKSDTEINLFLNYVLHNSKFEDNKNYIRSRVGLLA